MSGDGYDWGLSPEEANLFRNGLVVSVELSLGPENVEAVALLSGISIVEVSQWLDAHIERGRE